jgi:hypothetical protein
MVVYLVNVRLRFQFDKNENLSFAIMLEYFPRKSSAFKNLQYLRLVEVIAKKSLKSPLKLFVFGNGNVVCLTTTIVCFVFSMGSLLF